MFAATARAKLNLGLHITGKRADGYHLLESLFVFTELADRLTAEPAEGLSLEVTGPFAADAGAGPDNLVLRAARALQDATGTTQGARITLDKQVPVGGGLGGGSADAAAALRLLVHLWKLDVNKAALFALAPTLGADVSACIAGVPLIARGIGEQLEGLPWAFPSWPVVLVHPRIPLLTAEVYRHYLHPLGKAGLPTPAAMPTDLLGWLRDMRNDLQRPAIAVSPVVGEVLLAMKTALPTPALVRMTGSGACCFALFTEAEAAKKYAAQLRAAYPLWFVAETTIVGQ